MRTWTLSPWPAGLQNLTFGALFNQSLDKVTWPEGLQSLTFGVFFDQSLDNVTWPGGLQSLSCVSRKGRSLAESGVVLPMALRTLVTGDRHAADVLSKRSVVM